jgi:hypothetical protein
VAYNCCDEFVQEDVKAKHYAIDFLLRTQGNLVYAVSLNSTLLSPGILLHSNPGKEAKF